jgi:hypothetical protein
VQWSEHAVAAKLDAASRAKEVDLKVLLEETRVMMANFIIVDEETRAWYL